MARDGSLNTTSIYLALRIFPIVIQLKILISLNSFLFVISLCYLYSCSLGSDDVNDTHTHTRSPYWTICNVSEQLMCMCTDSRLRWRNYGIPSFDSNTNDTQHTHTHIHTQQTGANSARISEEAKMHAAGDIIYVGTAYCAHTTLKVYADIRLSVF